jgi:cation diffusion facilitator CzcD-associated flavoprotein CzcO
VLEADIIVTATGFNLSVMGDIAFAVDGKPVDFADTVTYRGMMFTGVPNMSGCSAISAPAGRCGPT